MRKRIIRKILLENKPAVILSTRFHIMRNRHSPHRRLEIGTGPERIPGFETLNISPGKHVDYVWDASKRLPFGRDSFELIYASHVLEHIPWYRTDAVLVEWMRVLRPGGVLEVWVPNGLKICKALVDYELTGENYIDLDGWYRYNPERDPYKWAAGRIFTYGDGTGDPKSPNWHRALFTPQSLRATFERVGLRAVRELHRSEVRGHDHGWINLGMTGTK